MTETLIGVGMLPRAQKDENVNPRGPLVLPKDSAALPAPTMPRPIRSPALLPEDSNKVADRRAATSPRRTSSACATRASSTCAPSMVAR